MEGFSPKFLLYSLRAFEERLASKALGTTFVAVSAKDLYSFPIPLPPLAEQHRIVARVQALLQQCDALEAKLRAVQAARENAWASLVAHLGGEA